MGANGSCCTPGERRCHCQEKSTEFKRICTGSTGGMVRLAGGVFLMGTDDPVGFPADGEGPIREITLDPFYMDETSVTNEQFKQFMEATGYQTDAQKFGYSYVFHLFLKRELK